MRKILFGVVLIAMLVFSTSSAIASYSSMPKKGTREILVYSIGSFDSFAEKNFLDLFNRAIGEWWQNRGKEKIRGSWSIFFDKELVRPSEAVKINIFIINNKKPDKIVSKGTVCCLSGKTLFVDLEDSAIGSAKKTIKIIETESASITSAE